MAVKRYNVYCPRQYKTRDGEEKTHFWLVGTAFPLRDRDGFTVEIYTRMLPGTGSSARLVAFVHEERDKDEPDEQPPEDGIPF